MFFSALSKACEKSNGALRRLWTISVDEAPHIQIDLPICKFSIVRSYLINANL